MRIFIPFVKGATGAEQASGFAMDNESVNFHPDGEGYLVNYPGKMDILLRDYEQYPSHIGSPFPTTAEITRLITFVDSGGEEHIVFVRDNMLCELYGNSFKELYQFKGSNVNGLYFPALFIHQSKLIICNFGDPTLIWDGLEAVDVLGVHEIPQAPLLRAHPIPGAAYLIPANGSDYEWGPFKYSQIWPLSDVPASGPSENMDIDSNDIDGLYRIKVAFVDKYGNKGRLSPPSNHTKVTRQELYEGSPLYTLNHKWMTKDYLISSWTPPTVEPHIRSTIVYRTPNLHPDDAQGGDLAHNSFYKEIEIPGTTQARFVHQIQDTTLIAAGEADYECGPPPQASLGCSWNGRIVLAGLIDESIVAISDVGYFGQFRALNTYRAKGRVVAVIGVQDRLLVISDKSIEILYEANGFIAVLDQDFANGSNWGRSFVDIGGAILGLYHRGFGVHDGIKLTFIDSPYYLNGEYIDNRQYALAARFVKDSYWLALRTNDSSAMRNNRLVRYDLKTQQWYQLQDDIYDIDFYADGTMVGCSDSIYQLFRGTYPISTLSFTEMLMGDMEETLYTRSIVSFALLMEPSSNEIVEALVADGYGVESSQTVARLTKLNGGVSVDDTTPCWDDINLLYSTEPKWSAPGDFWVKVNLEKPIASIAHKIRFDFPAGHMIRLKGLMIDINQGKDSLW